MADLIVQQPQSPFDSIRHIDQDGEFWLARELMPLLGYEKWERFSDAIERAKASCQNDGNQVREHFFPGVLKSGGRPREDYRLSRLGAYLTAMNGDPRKPEVAAAQKYFAVKARQAEVSESVQPRQLPRRDVVDYIEAAKSIPDIPDPLMRSLLSQRMYEELQGQNLALPGTSERLVAVAVRAGELGFKLGHGEDSLLGKYIKARFQPEGQIPHGRYQVNTYKLTPMLDEAIRSFFYTLQGEI